jgi:hypothetical protein
MTDDGHSKTLKTGGRMTDDRDQRPDVSKNLKLRKLKRCPVKSALGTPASGTAR